MWNKVPNKVPNRVSNLVLNRAPCKVYICMYYHYTTLNQSFGIYQEYELHFIYRISHYARTTNENCEIGKYNF